MGKHGPKPTPSAIKLAKGTLRKDRHGDPEKQPQSGPAELGTPPGHLGEPGRAAWLNVGPQLVASGVLTTLDVTPFLRYCEAHDQIAKLTKVIDEEGETFSTDKGFICGHPAVGQRFRWLAELRQFEARFGMTASDRCGIQLPTAKAGPRSRARA